MRYRIPLIILIGFTIPMVAVAAVALASYAVRGGEEGFEELSSSQPFTYQGKLLDDGQPELGPCSFQFGLWDAPTLGSQAGLTQTLTDVQLDYGQFTVLLNDAGQIGSSPFDGQALWISVDVECPSGSGSYVSLTPRQQLTAAPYTHYSAEASSAPWGVITSKPAGFADDIDDNTLYGTGTGLDLVTSTIALEDSYQLPQGCDTGYLVEWNGSGWGCLEPAAPGYANVVVVAKSGGDYETVQGALNSIIDASSDNPYLVWVAPGVYSETVAMRSWVDIEGAGEDLTRIQSAGFDSFGTATVIAAANSELRFLTIENTGGHDHSVSVAIHFDDFGLENARILASGGADYNIGIAVSGGTANNVIRHCLIAVDSQLATSASYGMYISANPGNISLVLDDLIVEANSSVDQDINGILQGAGPSYANVITATKLMIRATNTGSNDAWAFRSSGPGARLNLSNSFLHGDGNFGIGFYANNGGTFLAKNVELEGNYYGIRIHNSTSPASMRIDNAAIIGGTYSALVGGGSGNDLSVGTSLLDGDYFVAAGDTLTCVNSYDENYTNANGFDSCP